MSTQRKIAVIVGSLRRESISRKLASAMAKLAPAELQFEVIEIGDLPLYNEDLESGGATAPAEWTRFRQAVAACDAVLFVTPEYNRSIPSVLKNAVDVGSRPYGKAVWTGKPALVVSHSQGALGGFGANHHLRQCLVCLGMPTMANPEVYLSNSGSLVGEDGQINNGSSRDFLSQVMLGFADWIARNSRK